VIDVDEIKEEFENYREDVEFGGTKKLIKIYINQHYNGDIIKRYDYVINFKYIHCKELNEHNLYINNINDYSCNYMKKLINQKIIQNGNMYSNISNIYIYIYMYEL
jgi:hypothetical protein